MRLIPSALLTICGAALVTFPQEATQIDAFGPLGCEAYLARMDQSIQRARQSSDARVYLFVYEGKTVGTVGASRRLVTFYPLVGSTRAKIRSIKQLIASRNVRPDRFVLIDGGFRESPEVEIWLVPNGAIPPQPTPTKSKMRLRKGTPRGFCTSCCGPV